MESTDFNNYNLQEGTPEETLLIPLLVKSREFINSKAIIKDKKAFEIAQQLKFDAKRFDGGGIAAIGILTRTQLIDKAVSEFIRTNPTGVIINLGVGLDTRVSRFDNGKLHWYELDLPQVIKLRRRFFSEADRVKFISSSVTDLKWAEEINSKEASNILIIAEGLFMYLTEEQIKSVFAYIIKCFPKAHLYFDVVHSYFVEKSISSHFVWGIDKAEQITELDKRIRLLEHWSIGDFNKNRQGLLLRLLNILPSTRNRSQILHVSFE